MPDTVVRLHDRPLQLALDSFFVDKYPGVTSYTVAAIDPRTRASVREGVLSIFAQETGTGRIVVRAFDDDPKPAIDTMLVDVECMNHAFADEGDYFNVSVGDSWSYNYKSQDDLTRWGNVIVDGVAEWEVVAVADACSSEEDVILVDISETVQGTEFHEDRIRPPAPDTSYAVTWERTLRAQLHGGKDDFKLTIENYGNFDVFWRATSPIESASFDTSYRDGFGTLATRYSYSTRLGLNVGLTYYWRRVSGPSPTQGPGSATVELELR